MIVSGCEPPDVRMAAIEQALAEQCGRHRRDCLWIPHLYHIPESSELWKKLALHAGKVVLFCRMHPRPALWLLRRHGIVNEDMTILDLRSFATADAAMTAALEAVQVGHETDPGASAESLAPGETQRWEESVRARWYPVMDGSRCVNCGHCLQFCLFGVYELDAAGKVEVRNPDHCKTGCPACARICPQSAIMFPLHDKDAAIAGAPGQFVALDLAARKMFYTRTRQPCPMCGATAERKPATPTASSQICPECGRAQPEQSAATDATPATSLSLFDDLDALVDRLDQRMQRRP